MKRSSKKYIESLIKKQVQNIVESEKVSILFHGSKSCLNFDKFNFESSPYFYLTKDYEYALNFANDKDECVFSFMINTNNFLDLTPLGSEPLDFRDMVRKFHVITNGMYFPSQNIFEKFSYVPFWEIVRYDKNGLIKNALLNKGYDGMIMYETKDGKKSMSYVLFNNDPIIYSV